MIRKLPKPPVTRRRFANAWGELDYLCKKTHYWLYTRQDRSRAQRYLRRLEKMVHAVPANDLAIIREDALALVCEIKGEIGPSIAHRKREIELMERLHREAQSPKYAASTRAYMLQDRDKTALAHRHRILDALQRVNGHP